MSQESTRATTAPEHKEMPCFAASLPVQPCPCKACKADRAVPVPDNTGREVDTATFRKKTYAYAEALFKGTVPQTQEAWRNLVAHVQALAAREPAPVARDLDGLHDDEAKRLRRVVNLLGMESEVPDDDATLRACLFAVLGQIARKLSAGGGVARDLDVEAERREFEKAANAARFFPREIDFSMTKSPSGRDEYANSHLQSRWEGWLDHAARGSGDKANSAPPAPADAVLWELREMAAPFVEGPIPRAELGVAIRALEKLVAAGSAGTHTKEST